MRTEFKNAFSEQRSYLYPLPIIKNNKYLIDINPKLSELFRTSIKEGFIESPDLKPDYLDFFKMHDDGNTPIYQVNYHKLFFKYLENVNTLKFEKIQEVLNDKIKKYLSGDNESKQKLLKIISNQENCNTCQELGVNSLKVKKLFSILKSLDL